MEIASKLLTRERHGLSFTTEYKSWAGMRRRCMNKNNHAYSRYGGRGIVVCKSWNSFSSFLSDMGLKPSPQHSIDRINNDGNYEQKNCRWATYTQQTRNRRVYSRSKSGVTGVTLRKSGKWRAMIRVKCRLIHLGESFSLSKATELRKSAELKYWSNQ